MKIKVKPLSKNFKGFEKIHKGDWQDLYVCECYTHKVENDTIKYKKGDIVFIGLGFACELPKGYEGYILPRSSTFKKTGLILTNSKGIIDESYNGDNDEWKAMFFATRDGEIKIGQRLLQFRIQKKMAEIEFEYVEHLGNKDRGGYGSTGH